MEFVSVSIKTNEGNKTIGFISNSSELESALNDLRDYAKKTINLN